MKAVPLAAALIVASLLPAQAVEKTLSFKLVTKLIQMKDGEAQFFGVSITQDGRIGTKEYTFRPAESNGQSTYYFEDGSVAASFKATVVDGVVKGEYTVLSGTGAYEGAKGIGTIDGLNSPKSGLKGASLMNIVLKLDIPKTN